jgi:hypothetical protein
MFLSARCKVSKETLLSIIESLVDLGKFDEELWSENKIIWCEDFVLSIQDAYLKRKNNCIDRKSLLQLLDSLGVRKLLKSSSKQGLCIENDTNNTQTILDNNKVNKTKFNFKEKILEFVDNETLVSDYIDMRKLKKASLSKTVFDSILKECNDNNFEVSEALKICLEKNWIGFKYEWVKNINKNNDTNGKQFSNQKSAYVFDIDRIIEANVSRNQ